MVVHSVNVATMLPKQCECADQIYILSALLQCYVTTQTVVQCRWV